MRTDRPASSATRPPKIVLLTRRSRRTLSPAPHRKRSGPSGELLSLLRIDAMGLGGMLIEPDKVTERHRVSHIVGFGEWVESQGLFEPGHENGDAKRIEARVEQDQVIGQRRQTLLVVVCNLLNLRNHNRLD